MSFCEGDYVRTINRAYYDDVVPRGTVGQIIWIRKRYVGSPNEYYQYKVSFAEYPQGGGLDNMYVYDDLERICEEKN